MRELLGAGLPNRLQSRWITRAVVSDYEFTEPTSVLIQQGSDCGMQERRRGIANRADDADDWPYRISPEAHDLPFPPHYQVYGRGMIVGQWP